MRKTLSTDRAPAAVGPYSQAVISGNLLFVSGQIGLNPADGKMAEGFDAQARQVIANLQAVCEAADTSLDRAVKLTVYLTDLSRFPALNELMAGAFPADPPARATVEVSALPLDALVEMDAVVERDASD